MFLKDYSEFQIFLEPEISDNPRRKLSKKKRTGEVGPSHGSEAFDFIRRNEGLTVATYLANSDKFNLTGIKEYRHLEHDLKMHRLFLRNPVTGEEYRPSKNPDWTRDEHLIALNAYLKHRPQIPGKESAEISNLSKQLRQLRKVLGHEIAADFRNENGVYMKLMNFRRLDPTYEGVGLQRGNKDEAVVWELYAQRPEQLDLIVRNIIAGIEFIEHEKQDDIYELNVEANEGAVLSRVHCFRERKPAIVKKKKEAFLRRHGRLFCEACHFDFEVAYSSRGAGYIECHHLIAVSVLAPEQRTKLEDLVLLCSNCHRMVHRSLPWLSFEELCSLVRTS